MLRRKRCAVYATAFLDEIDERSKRPANQISMPHPRQREPRALHRKQDRNDIAEDVAYSGVRHHRPITLEITLVIKNSAQNQKEKKIGEVRKFHELGQPRTRELLEPKGRIHSCQPAIHREQLRVLPTRIDEVHEPAQFFETKQKKQVRIPMSPKMPETRLKSRTGTLACPLTPIAGFRSAQNQNDRRHQRLRANQFHRMG